MYVIFPADEVILLSYGVAQNPRFYQSRPALDHLREPIVPISAGIRPSTTISTSNLDNNITISTTSKDFLTIPNHNVRSTTSTKLRDPSPSVSFADDFMNKSRQNTVDENNYRTGDFYSNSNLNNISNSNNNLSASDGNGAKKKGKLKSKISKISLGKLGKISSSNEQLEGVPTRVTDDLELRISNPTFTRDNLRQKNFDAFFASGEPVYSLERKERSLLESSSLPLTPQSLATTIDTPSSFAATPVTPNTPPSFSSLPPSASTYREGSVGYPSSPTKSIISKQSSSTNSGSSSGNKRPKSSELFRSSADSSVKGDRCPKNEFFFRILRVLCLLSFEFY